MNFHFENELSRSHYIKVCYFNKSQAKRKLIKYNDCNF